MLIRSGMVAFHPSLEPLMADIDSVRPAPHNYNNGDVDEIMESIEQWGMYRPLQYQESTRYLVMGNHTWLACKELGAEIVPLVGLDVDDTTAEAMMVADNEIARKARPDHGLLVPLLERISDDRGTLVGTGMTKRDMEVIRHLNQIPLETEKYTAWPTFSVQVSPDVLQGFRYLTREADDDAQAFELLLRLAGWDGTD